MSKALGLIETIGLVPAIEAADAAVKAANVTLLGYESARGGGKITIKLAGDVGAVKAAVSAGVAAAQRVGKVYSQLVIARPHNEIDALIQQVDRGRARENGAPESQAAGRPAEQAAPEPEAPALEAPDAAPEAGPDGPAAAPARCAATTRTGEPCKLPARPGSAYCSIHRRLETAG